MGTLLKPSSDDVWLEFECAFVQKKDLISTFSKDFNSSVKFFLNSACNFLFALRCSGLAFCNDKFMLFKMLVICLRVYEILKIL